MSEENLDVNIAIPKISHFHVFRRRRQQEEKRKEFAIFFWKASKQCLKTNKNYFDGFTCDELFDVIFKIGSTMKSTFRR